MKINQLKTVQDLEELFRELNEPLYRYVYIRCGYNKELAEDLTQDVFMKAWEKRELFNQKKSTLKNWLYIIARNSLIDYYRKKKMSTCNYDDLEDLIKGKESKVDDEIMLEIVIKNLEKLNSDEKEILVLRYIQDLEITDIAQIINKSYNTTKVSIHRAIKHLKNIINKNNNE